MMSGTEINFLLCLTLPTCVAFPSFADGNIAMISVTIVTVTVKGVNQ